MVSARIGSSSTINTTGCSEHLLSALTAPTGLRSPTWYSVTRTASGRSSTTLMPPDLATTAAAGFRKRLSTVSAAAWHDGHHLVHLLDRQPGSERPAVSRLAAAF